MEDGHNKEINQGKDDVVRGARVRIVKKSKCIDRPIQKLYSLDVKCTDMDTPVRAAALRARDAVTIGAELDS